MKLFTAEAILPGPSFSSEIEGFTVQGNTIQTVLQDESEVSDAKDRADEWIDFRDRCIVPGFTDAHTHLRLLGKSLNSVDLEGIERIEAVTERLKPVAAETPADAWMYGQGWNPNAFREERWPHRSDLDCSEIPQPVVLESHDRHALWLNERALRRLGIDADTEAPEGGTIVRDEAGTPTGIFKEHAIHLVYNRLPSPSEEQHTKWLRDAIDHAFANGVTAVHDIGPLPTFRLLTSMDQNGRPLPVIHFYLLKEHWNAVDKNRTACSPEQLVTLEGLKLFSDGTLGAQTAALLEPYRRQLDGETTRGELILSVDEMKKWISRAAGDGFPTIIHAIGDRAVRRSLDAFSEALDGSDELVSPPRVEHAQFVHPDDLERFSELGVLASIQPCHLYQDRSVIERVMPDRTQCAFPIRSLLERGTDVVFGTDVPIEEIGPLRNIQAAVHRGKANEESFVPEERISVEKALELACVAPVRATGDASFRGTIEEGKQADFAVLSRNPLGVAPEEVGQISVRQTFVRGTCVYG